MPSGSAAEAGIDQTAGVVAVRDRLLATSWQLVGLIEQLRPRDAQRLLEAHYSAAAAAAAERVPPLQRWPELPESSYATYVGGTNHVRVARLLDFVEPGERILDIGIGYGYLTGVLIRSGLPEAYCGIDLTERYVTTTRKGLHFNGLDDDHVTLEIGDVYDLTAEWVQRHDPTLVLLLEVLEHVPDPQRALDGLAAVLPPGTSVIFTVPMLNRLEGVWGHRSVFDAQRLKALCAHAGLTIQYVEPLQNVWALVLATTSPEMPSRLVSMAAAPAPDPVVAPPHGYVFEDVPLDRPVEEYARLGRPQRGKTVLSRTGSGLSCRIEAGGARPPYSGGLAFPADAPALIRLQVRYDEPDGIEAMYVDGYDGDERVARWRWTIGAQPPAPGERLVHVLKPDGAGRFVGRGRIEAHRVDRVELFAELAPDADKAAFTLARAGFVPKLAAP